ncbi:MAG: SDR family oxidoreductase [Pseudomonadota bacterium]
MTTGKSLEGRVLVLTGANGGIGRAIAEKFYAEGANLVLSDVDSAGLEAFANSLDPQGERLVTVVADSALPESAEHIADTAKSCFGGIDFLVPSAAIYLAQPLTSLSDEEWRRVLSLNLDGVFYLVRRSVHLLREGSAIVNLSSMAAHRGSFYNSHYGSSKGALLSLTRSLARELAPKTRVNAVSPGIIDTPMVTELLEVRGDESIRQTPLNRLGKPSEVASVVHFLCTDASSFITGEVIHVNGGLYIAG